MDKLIVHFINRQTFIVYLPTRGTHNKLSNVIIHTQELSTFSVQTKTLNNQYFVQNNKKQ